ncbi:hypothetical protein [Aliidiomarina maris]|uniref:EVE domain-containing protein n=1 Tax=Aliidiomarina maris TaxID=531312 RepID=A0A327X3E9_9GAMM|nr:hypothetical protein [Aliidiomarina maris]RAK01640.1 hypothetical protein B0I24_101263 [Aliidiomarina maris]RUO28464.1 hypothetical protein CWE07_01255 [Aliidiomarina maris]
MRKQPSNSKQHFILMKRDGFDNQGSLISATSGIQALCRAGYWPLWERTRCKSMVKPGDDLLLYSAGDGKDTKHIVGFAKVERIDTWRAEYAKSYPILLDGVPERILILSKQTLFKRPLSMREVIAKMSFAPDNLKKWGVCFMGGMRSIPTKDFDILMKEIVKVQGEAV